MDWNLIYVVIAWAAGVGGVVWLIGHFTGILPGVRDWFAEKVKDNKWGRYLKVIFEMATFVAEDVLNDMDEPLQAALANDGRISEDEWEGEDGLRAKILTSFKASVGSRWDDMVPAFKGKEFLEKYVLRAVMAMVKRRIAQPGN